MLSEERFMSNSGQLMAESVMRIMNIKLLYYVKLITITDLIQELQEIDEDCLDNFVSIFINMRTQCL